LKRDSLSYLLCIKRVALRSGSPPVLGRILRGRCLLDLRALPATADAELLTAVLAVR
jgi:L-seryl-tRNA(Ser) seleniumtransferase